MAIVSRYDAAFSIFVNRYIRNNVHTAIRGRVISVDYSGPSVDVQPMAKTVFENGTVDQYPAIYNVPLNLPSGGKGRLTMPVKPGDIVGLTFSERNEDSSTDVNTHQLFPGWAVTQIYTDGNKKAISPDDVVLENDKAIITLKETGEMSFKSPKAEIHVAESGNIEITSSKAKVVVQQDGNINMNGLQVTPDGNLITAKGVNMNDFYDWFVAHTHHYYWTDGGGEANTGAAQK